MNVQRYFLDMNSKMDLLPAECGIAGLVIEESDKSDLQYCNGLDLNKISSFPKN